jgi:hypothetical protein
MHTVPVISACKQHYGIIAHVEYCWRVRRSCKYRVLLRAIKCQHYRQSQIEDTHTSIEFDHSCVTRYHNYVRIRYSKQFVAQLTCAISSAQKRYR